MKNRKIILYAYVFVTTLLIHLHSTQSQTLTTTDTDTETDADTNTDTGTPEVLYMSDSAEEDIDSTSPATLSTSVEPTITQTRLRTVSTLDENCVQNVCSGFNYPYPDEAAYFNLQQRVRIAENAATYDIIKPIPYTSLTFTNSTFAHFPLNLFYAIISLHELDIRSCSIEIMTWQNFLMAHTLRILLLSYNRLRKIQFRTFEHAKQLQYLFLDNNLITELDGNAFADLESLTYLTLAHNRLRELPTGVFHGLRNLHELYLEYNQLKTIDNNIFMGNSHLKMVNLQNNDLEYLGEYVFQEQTMTMLDLSHNPRLKRLVVNLTAQYLIAMNCSLYRVNVYGGVSEVDMRDNAILELYFSQPELLELLNLRNNALEQIASLSLAKKLHTLNLADNPDLVFLPEPWIAPSLKRLDLSNTSLRLLPKSMFDQLPELRFLNVSHNKLQNIDTGMFNAVSRLEAFHIQGNLWNCFNLKLLMQMVMIPNGIRTGWDKFYPEFPGEYINGIACMYRNSEYVESQEAILGFLRDEEEPIQNVRIQSQSKEQLADLQEAPTNEGLSQQVENLQKELHVLSEFYTRRLNEAFTKIDDLNERLLEFERVNETLWSHITIQT